VSEPQRRTFLKQAGVSVAVAAVATRGAHGALAANEELTHALVGCGGRGTSVAELFAAQPEVNVGYVCDPDSERAAKAAQAVASVQGRAPKTVSDLRKILDDGSVDLVHIATPDHWHAPAALLALEAGKHVYVEKPCCHNIREGRLMVEAARRHNRVVQTGTQSRSSEHNLAAMRRLKEGAIGEILVAKAWNSQRRRDIGHATPSEPPKGFDYDLWLGPAPWMPFQANRHHYFWHWWYATGTGDFGNDGVHDVDIARWGLGVEEHPSRITALGGKYFFDDDQQFPDTQYVAFEYPGASKSDRPKQLIFELRIWSPYRQEGFENGDAFYGTEGCMILGKNEGWQLYGPKNELIESMKAGDRDVPHVRNFIECVQSGELPNAHAEIGHLSAALCHLGNIAVRAGTMLEFDPKAEQITNNEEANRLVGRDYREGHWAAPKDA